MHRFVPARFKFKIMENTLANKAKLFAQYWGQEVLCFNDENQYKPGVCYEVDGSIDDYTFLELKPISSITDEDAIECCRFKSELSFFTKKKWQVIRYEHHLIVESKGSAHSFSIDFVSGDVEFYNDQGLEVTSSDTTKDYLRSKGYATYWMKLSVEEQVNRGWVVLNQSEWTTTS